MTEPIRYTAAQFDTAYEQWGMNCGPGALCGVLNMSPDELRPHMGDFESKRYTNPTLMFQTLKRLGIQYVQTYRADEPRGWPRIKYGFMRIQWGGPWCNLGVPMQARYRNTHWIGVRSVSLLFSDTEIFDVNAMLDGGWLKYNVWENQLVPWLMSEDKKWDKTWWPTHGIEVAKP